ncbi:MAG TPA: hypothetical protein G4O08_13100 [Anaerolineae bacterium]|nr:hypothetical protein [Anaerolineae bacterium]
MQPEVKNRFGRLVMYLVFLTLAGGLMACSVTVAVSWGEDEDDSWEALATANSHLSTRVASNEVILSYLATAMPREPRVARLPTYTPTPYLPVHGVVTIEGGRCCVGGVAGDSIQVGVDFRAASPIAEVVEMRVRTGSMPFNEREMAQADWEPFASHRRFPVEVVINWVGFYVSVQYRDAQGNLSPIYFDDISVEGMPPTPTVAPD